MNNTTPRTRCAFTIATGKQIYLDMAIALARSFLLHNNSGINFYIISDHSVESRPNDLNAIHWITIQNGAYGYGFTPKLFLDLLAPHDISLFIDADCLIVKSLEATFKAFDGCPVAVLGRPISEGEWFGDVKAITKRLGVDCIPRFNGGVYYLEKGPVCSAVYETARSLLPRYDDLGFVRLRGSENDEVLMASAMALHKIPPLSEDGTIMHTLMEAPGGVSIDTIEGRAVLLNPRCHPNHFSWMPLERMEPAIVHFLGSSPNDHPYRTEILVLELAAKRVPIILARLISYVWSAWPWHIKNFFRNLFRPLYRMIFGIRAINNRSR